MGKQEIREERILEVLKRKHKITTGEAMDLLDISESTARRLFASLETQKKVIRRYGGIQLAGRSPVDYSFDQLMESSQEEESAIASYAVSLIQESDILFFDSGTTVYYLSQALAEKLKTGQLKEITIFTNSLANMQLLHALCRVILIGGEYRQKRMDFAGYASNKFIGHFHFTKAFLGADGICMDEGFMTTDTDTASMSELAISRSDLAYVLSDSRKLGKKSFLSYSPISGVDALITGNTAECEYLDQLRQSGLSIHTVS